MQLNSDTTHLELALNPTGKEATPPTLRCQWQDQVVSYASDQQASQRFQCLPT